MKKMRNVFQMLALVVSLMLVGGLTMNCASPSGPNNNPPVAPTPDPNPDPDPDAEWVDITITIQSQDLADLEQQWSEIQIADGVAPNLLTPGVPPGTIGLYGTLIGINNPALGRACYSPYQDTTPANNVRDCVVDYSGSVAGGQLVLTFRAPISWLWHLAYNLDGKLRADSITVQVSGGPVVPLTNVCVLGDPATYYTWMVVSAQLLRSETGALSVEPNAACNIPQARMRINLNGDSATASYDDLATLLPYNCSAEGFQFLNASLYDTFASGAGTRQTMATCTAGAIGWYEDFYVALTGATPSAPNVRFSFNVSAYRASREPTAPPGTEEVALPIRAGFYNVISGAQISAPAELIHIIDQVTGVGTYYTHTVEYVSPAGVMTMLPENRDDALGGP